MTVFRRTIDVDADDSDLSEVLTKIARDAGKTVIVAPDVHERVTVTLCRIPWFDALAVVAKLCRCELEVQGDTILVSRRTTLTVHVEDRDLWALLHDFADEESLGLVVSPEVELGAKPVCSDNGRTVPIVGLVERLAAENSLRVTRVGDLRVITKTPTADGVASVSSGDEVNARAWSAPAEGWFALLARARGGCAEHGDSPITLHVDGKSLADIEAATVIASRFSRGTSKPLHDLPPERELPSGRVVSIEVQAIISRNGGCLALVNGRVLALGDELVPGLRVVAIYGDAVGFTDGDEAFTLRHP